MGSKPGNSRLLTFDLFSFAVGTILDMISCRWDAPPNETGETVMTKRMDDKDLANVSGAGESEAPSVAPPSSGGGGAGVGPGFQRPGGNDGDHSDYSKK
jgi:hypothetical protein